MLLLLSVPHSQFKAFNYRLLRGRVSFLSEFNVNANSNFFLVTPLSSETYKSNS